MVSVTNKRYASYICKVCGKERKWNQTRDHIEANHLRVSVPCYCCEKTFATRNGLSHLKKVTMKRSFELVAKVAQMLEYFILNILTAHC